MDNRLLVSDQIFDSLSSNSNGIVIGLTGQWGVGKTYLWKNSIITRLGSRNIIEVSALGADSSNALLKKIVNKSLINQGKKITKGKSEAIEIAKNSGELLLTGFKVVMKGLDSYIGTNILSMNIDLLGLVTENCIICVDDIERTSLGISYEETLGLFRVLADEKKCKILVIFNDKVLDEERQKIFKTYSEKIFDKKFHIELDIEEVLSTKCLMLKSGLDKKVFTFKEILRVFVRSGNTNLRTLNRISDTLTEFANSQKISLDQHQIDFICAMIIEDSEGNLRSADFYSGINPVSFYLFKNENEVKDRPEFQFYQRYFGTGESYKFYKSYYNFVKFGFIDWDQSKLEIDPPAPRETPGLKTVRSIDDSEWYFLSEFDLKAEQSKLKHFLEGSEEATVPQLFKIYIYFRLSFNWLGIQYQPGTLEEKLLQRLLEIAPTEEEKNYGSLQMMHFSDQREIWDDLYQKYRAGRTNDQKMSAITTVAEIVERADLGEMISALRTDMDLLKLFLDGLVLDNIIRKQNKNPKFAIRAMMTLIEEANAKPQEIVGKRKNEIREIFLTALSTGIANTNDERAKSRLRDVIAQLNKFFPQPTSTNNQPSVPTSKTTTKKDNI